MKKSAKKPPIPDITEFTDDEGKKWVQTSTDDFFSLKELNEILESVEKEKQSGEVVLARIDFQRVNKKYYDAAVILQKKLSRQSELLKKVINESKRIIERKNTKLKELITYIRKMHVFLSYLSSNEETLDKISIPKEIFTELPKEPGHSQSVYQDVEEIVVPLDAEEKDLIK